MAGISSLGIGSGVLNSDLVDQLIAAERKPTEMRLTQKTQQADAMLSAYGKLRSAVTELRLPMRQLSAPDNLKAFSASSSNDDIGVSIDSTKANRGTYSVEVTGLASAQALASQAVFADRDSTSVGQGTLQLSVGDKNTSITIDDSNDTLQGLANAINESGSGVSAGVIDTGDGYQLVLSADESGTANAVSISVSGDDGGTDTDNQGLSRFAFNSGMDAGAGLDETIAASDAKMSINGVTVTRSTNTFENVIDGLTFDIKAEGTSTIKVEQDLGAVSDRVQSFVDKFNGLQSTIDGLAGFNTEAGVGSLLTGDATVRTIQNQMRQILTRVVPGLENASVRSLADVGVTTDWETGGLEFDRAKFEEQLKANPDDVTALFAEQGRTTDSQVEFVRSGLDTVPGSYDINVTEAATRGSLNYPASEIGTINVKAGNQFTFMVDGETQVNAYLEFAPDGTSLPGGGVDFTGEEFAAAMQQALNISNELKASGRSVEVAWDATDGLTFTSADYGSDSNVSLTGVLNAPGFNSKDGVAGTDVAGTIDGQVAEGDGQVLYLGNDNGGASGLQVRILGDQTGDRGSITFVEGVAERTVELVTNLVGADGAIEARTESLSRELEQIQKNQVRLDERLASYRERLVSQFSAADSMISQLNSTRDYITQQLAALAPQNRNQ